MRKIKWEREVRLSLKEPFQDYDISPPCPDCNDPICRVWHALVFDRKKTPSKRPSYCRNWMKNVMWSDGGWVVASTPIKYSLPQPLSDLHKEVSFKDLKYDALLCGMCYTIILTTLITIDLCKVINKESGFWETILSLQFATTECILAPLLGSSIYEKANIVQLKAQTLLD